MEQFVHLHLHTEYSIKDSVLRIPALFEKAKALQFSAVAITDINNLFATIKFYTQAIERDIKPIIGCELSIAADALSPHNDQCVVLCLNERGYRNLSQLISIAYLEGYGNKGPAVKRIDLEQYNEGLLILSGALRGAFAKAILQNDKQQTRKLLEFWTSVFGDRFYIELQHTGREREQDYIAQALKLAKHTALPVVASNDVCFLGKEDFALHEIKACIADGCTLNDKHRRQNIYSSEQYLKSTEEMAALFKEIPSAIQNSVEIAKRCTVELQLKQTHMPSFPIEAGLEIKGKLRGDARTGLEKYLVKNGDLNRDAYASRLEEELEIIREMGYEGYFLIVADFIMWAKNQGIPVGPGRGSGSGSLVAYVLGITEIDPMQYGLFFERFLNPDRVSLPDFDVDFCIEGRDRVIQYVVERYGRDNVSHIVTFGSLGAKAVVRDVTRVLGYPYGLGDDIVKLIPSRLNITLKEALEDSPELKARYKGEDKVKRIIDRALGLEGLVRNAGQHAGGIVIAPSPLTDYTALYKEPGHQNAATHFDMKDIEKIGLVKFDFLGLKTLTIINKAIASIRQHNGATLEPAQIPLDDSKAYNLLQSGNTTALFQLESGGMRSLIKKLKPDRFEDIVALVALYRPGPLQAGMDDEYVNRKHGQEFIYQHPSLEPILKETYGVILYQEQVMQIAQVLAGYTLGSADILRRAMGKKIPQEMADQRAVFVAGAIENNVDRNTATKLFDLIEYFAGYGFNKSHSVAYALIAYQTAWLKSNHSGAFMAAVLSSEMSDTDKIIELLDECRNLGLTIAPPSINRSEYEFVEIEKDKILYGLGAIKQVGYEMVKNIVDEKESGGNYQSLSDFCRRLVPRIRSNMIEQLIAAGAFDEIESDRGVALQSLEAVYTLAEQSSRDRKSGQSNLFGEDASANANVISRVKSKITTFSYEQLLEKEKSSLGFYLKEHPVSKHKDELRHIVNYNTLNDFKKATAASKEAERKAVWLGGIMSKVETKIIMPSRKKETDGKARTKRSKQAAFFILDDGTDKIKLSLFDADYKNCKDKLSHQGIVVVGVYKAAYDIKNANDRWRASRIMTLAEAQKSFAKKLNIVWDISALNDAKGDNLVDRLTASLQPFIQNSGGCKVYILFRNVDAETLMILPESCRVEPNKQLIVSIKSIPGIQDVAVQYEARH